MTQGELEKIPLVLQKQFSDLEIRIMDDIVRRIKINGFSTASADWQITRLQQLGKSEEDIKEWIRMALEVSEEEIERIFSDEVYEQYMGHERAYQVNGMKQIPFEENQELQSLVEGIKQQTNDTFRNMTASLGFVRQDVQGHIQGITLTDFYRITLDQAMLDIHSGAFDYQTVLRRTIEDMTKSGVRWIDYKGGRHNRIDVAARRAVMTGFRQIQGKINEQVAFDLRTDSYEVTYHVGARPSHQPWQGKVWTMQQLKDVCGLGSVTGLHGANCYHDYNAFIPGVSVRTYTDQQLKQMTDRENEKKAYNGKEYTTYEALQQQRKMERTMRKTREDIHLMEEGEADSQSILLKKAKYQGQMQTYKDFSKKMGLPEQMDRVYQDGLSGKFMPTKAELRGMDKTVAKTSDFGIIKAEAAKEENAMVEIQHLGKINTEVLEREFGKIQTDEIIVTNERIAHIKERHPEDYILFERYGKESVIAPDLIIKDIKHEGTVFMVKKLPETNLNVVVRVVLETDDSRLKNSVMTFYRIRERNLRKLIEKNDLLYKKE